MLETGGITVRSRFRSGAEVIRAIKKMEGGIVICGYKLSDMSFACLADSLNGSAMLLIIGSPSQLEYCHSDDVFILPAPASRSDLIASVRMLIQMEQKYLKLTLPQRNKEDELLLEKAKEFLIDKNRMTEAQAHKFIQKKSMDGGSTMTETARLIIEKNRPDHAELA